MNVDATVTLYDMLFLDRVACLLYKTDKLHYILEFC